MEMWKWEEEAGWLEMGEEEGRWKVVKWKKIWCRLRSKDVAGLLKDDDNMGWSTISHNRTDYLEATELSRFTHPRLRLD